jgi:hypothetical protein
MLGEVEALGLGLVEQDREDRFGSQDGMKPEWGAGAAPASTRARKWASCLALRREASSLQIEA